MSINASRAVEHFRKVGIDAVPLGAKDCIEFDEIWRLAFLGSSFKQMQKRSRKLSALVTRHYDGAVFLPDSEVQYNQFLEGGAFSYVYSTYGPADGAVIIHDGVLPTVECLTGAPCVEDACIFPTTLDWSLLLLTEEAFTRKHICLLWPNQLRPCL